MTWYGSLIVYSTDAFSEHYCQTRASLSSININSNIFYEACWNIEYKCDSSVYFFLFTVSREEDIARESFSFKISLRSPW